MRLFGPPNVEKMKARGNVKGLIRALRYRKDAKVREAAAEALEKIGDPRAVEPLIAALRDNVWVRRAAAEALVKIGAPAVEPLIAALGDKDSDIREAAAEVLGAIGDTRAVEPLIAALRDWDKDVREAAAVALGKIGDPRAVEPLIAALRDEQLGNVRRAAVEALGRIGDPCAVEPLITAIRDENSIVREAAAEALVKIGAPAVEPLIAALRGEDPLVRLVAFEALGKMKDPRAAEALAVISSEKTADEWCAEGNDLAGRGLYREALACLTKALEIDPKHALTWFNMGLTLMNLGKKKEAIEAFQAFIKYAPPEAQALHVPVAKGYIQMLSTGAGLIRIHLGPLG